MRPNISVIYSLIRTVSIHASVKDATFQILFSTAKVSFNPRICKRCDRLWIWKQLSRLSFNPRICKRCDLDSQRPNISMTCFNPRICKRCDNFQTRHLNCIISFNPRICKRCDKKSGGEVNVDYVSIHASVKDATPNANVPITLI